MSCHTLITFLLIYLLRGTDAVNVTNYRLPNNTKPHLYEIDLDFDVYGDNMPVKGSSLITFEVIKATDCITLHKAKKIVIEEEYTEVEGRNVIEQSWTPDEFFKIKLSEYLTVGNYSLKLRWSVYNNNSEDIGFFRFFDKVDSRFAAGTRNLVPTFARRVFPCWDEPFYKAEFKFSVKHPENTIALSNMPEIGRKFEESDRILTTFDKSPRLSPHSTGIALTNYDVIKNQYNNLTFYTITQDDRKIENLMNMTTEILFLMEKYTKIPYPMPKLDIIIADHLPDAVTNLGLMILRSDDIIFPKIESKMALYQYKKTEILMLAEALAVQWFGNLVTPSWWNDLWLSYGISNFVAAEIIDQIYKNETTKARDWLSIDAYKSFSGLMLLSPIRFLSKLDSPRNIEKQFDNFYIARNVLIVRMLEHIVTAKVFKIRLQNYLSKNKFSAVTTEDFWACFQDQSIDFNVQRMMDPWLENLGYAILEVSCDRETNNIKIVQKNVLGSFINVTRPIPINYATKSNPNFLNATPVFWMHGNESMISLTNKEDWIIFNVQQLDQYQVVYDKENWNRIISYLNTDEFERIHPINRAIIIQELNRKAINEKNLKIMVDLLPYLRWEKNLLPLYSAYHLIFRLSSRLTWPLVDGFSNFITFILKYIIKNLHDNYLTTVDNYFYKEAKVLKSLFMRIFCTLKKTADCKDFAIEIVNYIAAHPAEEIYLHDYSWSWTLCLVLNNYDEDQWDYFFSNNYSLMRNDLYWKYKYLRCAKSAEVVKNYFPKLLEDNIGTSVNQFMAVFNFVMKYADNDKIQTMLDYFFNNFDLLQERFKNESFNEVVYNMMTLFSIFIKNKKQWNELERFIILKSDELDNQYNASIKNTMKYLHLSTIKESYKFKNIIHEKLKKIRPIL